MTEKELLYFEDAIGHEKNIVSSLNQSVNMVTDEDIKSFLNSEITKHKSIENDLMNMLGGKANVW